MEGWMEGEMQLGGWRLHDRVEGEGWWSLTNDLFISGWD